MKACPKCITVPRFRLSLVCESESPYGGAPLSDNPAAAVELLWRDVYSDAAQEKMAAVFLDVRNRVIGVQVAYVGTLTRAAVEPRAILAAALLCNASGFLLAHNHPSGDPAPTVEDLEFTRRIADAGKVLGVRLVDHVILAGAGRWVSLKLRGGW
jgi:DNA repair protein RadC